MKVSVILPAYNEESVIYRTLENLILKHRPDEVLVVDGGSQDKTASLANEWARVLRSEKGRAKQMNAGAYAATGDIFLFLHADTQLPAGAIDLIRETVSGGNPAGRFRVRFDKRHWPLRFYESYTRFHFFSYGDQGFFLTRRLFFELGGYREEVPFEDIDFYRRLRRKTNPVILKEAVTTSARRFSNTGCLRQKLINFFLVGLYYAGFNVFRLKEKLYPEIR